MTPLGRRAVIGAGLALPVMARAAATPKPNPVRIGVLTDLSGPYSLIAGQGSVSCASQAVREFAPGAGFGIEVLSADHHNDPRTGAAIARGWYRDQGVDLIVDVPNSEVALAVAAVAREANRVYVNTGAGTERLTGDACSPNTIHWSYDTAMLTRSTGGAVVRGGGATWFFISADYAFGRELQAAMSRAVLQAGGRIDGGETYKFPGHPDFAPMLRQAAQSGAQVLGLANAGQDVTACVRAVRAEGLMDQLRVACLLMQIADVHALGLEAAGGLMLTESFYWDLNDRTRAFTGRLLAAEPAAPHPDMIQAGCYAATLHFLKAVAAMGVANARSDGASVVAKMKATPTDDDAFGQGAIRRDGRAMFPAMLFQVKTAGESTGPWDYYRELSATPAEETARALAEGGCEFVKS